MDIHENELQFVLQQLKGHRATHRRYLAKYVQGEEIPQEAQELIDETISP